MVVKATQVIGLPIVTIARGKEIDKVEDVIYDPFQNQVKALLIDKGGWFAEAKIILIHDAVRIGEDAVLIEDQDKIRKAGEVKNEVASIAKKDNFLTGTKVIAENGKELGSVSDIAFDTATGDVEEFEVSQGLLKNIESGKKHFKVSEVVTVGEDVTIVKSYTEEKFARQSEEQGVRGAVNKTKEKATSRETKNKASGVMDEARNRMQDLGERVHDKIEEIRNSPQTRKTVSKVKSKANEAKRIAASKTEEEMMRITEERKKAAVGQYLTTNVLTSDDRPLGKRGDMVTHDMIERAQSQGVLEKILGNTSNTPPVKSRSR